MGEESGSGGGSINEKKKRGSGISPTSPINKNLSTAKSEEFSKPGSRYTGTTTARPGYGRGMSPLDSSVITGDSSFSGRGGLNVDNVGNLQQRATTDVIQGKAGFVPGAGFINTMSKFTASKIKDKISAGGTQVLNTSGKIVGVVDKNALGLDVYTGQGGYSPIGIGKKAGKTGYVMTAGDVSAAERMSSGGDEDRPVGGATDQPAKDVTDSTTKLSPAARRTSVAALGAGSGGASRRQCI